MTVDGFGKAYAAMHDVCGWEYVYKQLAEECCELGKAALKMIRSGNNDTPDPVDVVADNYIEELADVWLMIAIARTDLEKAEAEQFDRTVQFKFDRLMKRMEEKKNARSSDA